MKTKNIFAIILCSSIILVVSSHVSAQLQIGFKITEDCITECAAPVTIKGYVKLQDAEQDDCVQIYSFIYSQNDTYWVEFTSCPPEFDGPSGWIKIHIEFYDQYNDFCCEYDYEDHWTQWDEIFTIDMTI